MYYEDVFNPKKTLFLKKVTGQMSRVYITIVVKDKKYVFEALEISKIKRQP